MGPPSNSVRLPYKWLNELWFMVYSELVFIGWIYTYLRSILQAQFWPRFVDENFPISNRSSFSGRSAAGRRCHGHWCSLCPRECRCLQLHLQAGKHRVKNQVKSNKNGWRPNKNGWKPNKNHGFTWFNRLTIKNLWFDLIFFRKTWSKKQGKHEKKLVEVHHQEWCFFLHPKHVKKVVGIQQTKRMTFKTKMVPSGNLT